MMIPFPGEAIKSIFPVINKLFWQNNSRVQRTLTPFLLSESSIHSQNRSLSTQPLTKNIELITNASTVKINNTKDRSFKVVTSNSKIDEERPLIIILSWLMSEKKHLLKYANFYLNQGFDVLTVRPNPWQLLFPVNGTQTIAKDLISFMETNDQYHSTLVHGFSVGGYLFGEVLAILEQDLHRYQPLINRVVGQIWDSVVDFEGIPTGLPKAVFPKNQVLRVNFEKYVRYHLKKFDKVATRHYLKSSQSYHNSVIRSPALFLCSLDDPVGNKQGIQKVIDKWEANNMTVYLKCWESSPHVSHLHHHPEEYKQEMKSFLEKLGLLPYPERFRPHIHHYYDQQHKEKISQRN